MESVQGNLKATPHDVSDLKEFPFLGEAGNQTDLPNFKSELKYIERTENPRRKVVLHSQTSRTITSPFSERKCELQQCLKQCELELTIIKGPI